MDLIDACHALDLIPTVVVSARSSAIYKDVAREAVPAEFAVRRRGESNQHDIVGRKGGYAITGIGYTNDRGDRYSTLVLSFSTAH